MALYKYQDRFWTDYVKYLKAADNFHLIPHAAMLTSYVLLSMYHHTWGVSQWRKYLESINCGGSHDKF